MARGDAIIVCVCDDEKATEKVSNYICANCNGVILCDFCDRAATNRHVDYYTCVTHRQNAVENISTRGW